MFLIQTLKNDVRRAMLAHDHVRKDVLKVVIADAEREAGFLPPEDEIVRRTIKKQIKSNRECISYMPGGERSAKLVSENAVLKEYIPATMEVEEIAGFFLNSDGDEFEQMLDAKEPVALGIAMKSLKAAGKVVDVEDVKLAVANLRSPENA